MGNPQLKLEGERVVRKIALKPEDIYITKMDHDVVISVRIGGERLQAMVPAKSLHEQSGITFVPAEQIGRVGDKLVLVLPPSNEGTPYWHVREADLNKITVP